MFVTLLVAVFFASLAVTFVLLLLVGWKKLTEKKPVPSSPELFEIIGAVEDEPGRAYYTMIRGAGEPTHSDQAILFQMPILAQGSAPTHCFCLKREAYQSLVATLGEQFPWWCERLEWTWSNGESLLVIYGSEMDVNWFMGRYRDVWLEAFTRTLHLCLWADHQPLRRLISSVSAQELIDLCHRNQHSVAWTELAQLMVRGAEKLCQAWSPAEMNTLAMVASRQASPGSLLHFRALKYVALYHYLREDTEGVAAVHQELYGVCRDRLASFERAVEKLLTVPRGKASVMRSISSLTRRIQKKAGAA